VPYPRKFLCFNLTKIIPGVLMGHSSIWVHFYSLFASCVVLIPGTLRRSDRSDLKLHSNWERDPTRVGRAFLPPYMFHPWLGQTTRPQHVLDDLHWPRRDRREPFGPTRIPSHSSHAKGTAWIGYEMGLRNKVMMK